MLRLRPLVTALALGALLLPGAAHAQAELMSGPWAARWALPLFVGDSLVLFGLGIGLSAPGWNRLGLLLWLLCVTAGGGLFIYALAYAPHGETWQIPALLAGVGVFAFSAERACQQLSGKDRPRS